MGELVRGRTDLSDADVDWLHRVVGEWQLLADLSFADLLLWVPLRTVGDQAPDAFVAVAQMRPTTGPTAYQRDRVGEVVTAAQRPQLRAAMAEGRICRESDPVWSDGGPVREETIPVCRAGRLLAVVGRDTPLASARTPSRLEIAYLQTANDLAQMVAEGSFPFPGPAPDDDGPRVGDGLLRLDADGVVEFASPNALSAYRRLGFPGDLLGRHLASTTAQLALRADRAAEPVSAVATGLRPRTVDVETVEATVQLRVIPLRSAGRHIGAVVLVHDVTEVRRRDRQLTTKDATIREIHHRVKNNLQTVAALLRLQARRMAVPEARAALEESVRRIGSIALVHETLSGGLDEQVDFDAIVARVAGVVGDVAGTDRAVTIRRDGAFGVLPAAVATPLAMVLTELLQNAAQHGLAGREGTVRVDATRRDGTLLVTVADDGAGLPPGFDLAGSGGLGLQIVRTLVENELGGSLTLTPGATGGTAARLSVPLAAGSPG